MIFEIYLSRLVFYSILAFLFGVIFSTSAIMNSDKTIDFFFLFKKLNLNKAFDFVWSPFEKIFIGVVKK